MVKGNMCGTTARAMMDTGLRTRSMGMESTYGLMEEGTMESGKTTTCMARVYTLGRMAEGMKESTSTIASMAMAFILGPMAGSILANGRTESNTEKGDIGKLMARRERVSGRMAKDSNGVMRPNNDLIELIYI